MILSKLKINAFGFTIMEAMVTVAIIAIMSAVYLTNYRPTNQKIALDQAVAGVVADLRNAQNMAMNVKKFEGAIPCGGYGINISDATSYIIFADKDDGTNPPICTNDKIYTVALTEKVSDRTLPARINFVIASSLSNIDFQPPNPIVWIDGQTGAAVTVSTIILEYGTTGVTKTITINGYTGQISVN